MFLQPHHFQAGHRHMTDRIRRAAAWESHHCWGLRSIDINADALLNSRLVVRSLLCVLRDGTPIAVPCDVTLPPP